MASARDDAPIPIDDRFRVMSPNDPASEMVGLRAEIKLWCDRPFNEYADTFLAAWDLLAAPIRAELNWYQNYTMDRFSKVGPRVWTAPKTWLTRGPFDVARSLNLKASEGLSDVGRSSLMFKYHPDDALYANANTPFVRRSVPSAWLREDPQAFVDLAQQLGERLPFLCGHVGYALSLSPYEPVNAQRAAYPLARRFIGVAIEGDQATWPLRDDKGVETVNWLTFVGDIPLRALGGRATVERAAKELPDVSVIGVAHGLILRAGERPQLGDRNRKDDLPAYRAVYGLLRKVIEPINADFRSFNLGTADDAGATDEWLKRFE